MKEPFLINHTDIQRICSDNLTGNKSDTQNIYGETSATVRAVLGIMITLTTVVSIFGNLLTCLIVYRKSSMRSAINLLLTNMAIADLSLATIVMPFILCGMVRSRIHYHDAVCLCFSILKDIFIGVVCYTMLAVSMDRYMIIVHRRDGICPKLAKRIIVLTWIGSITIALLQLVSIREHKIMYHYNILCGHDLCKLQTLSVVYTTVLVCVTFFIPVGAMLYFYAAVLRTVQKCSSKIHNHPGRNICVSVTQYSCKLGLPTRAIPVSFTGDFNAKRRAFGTILLMFIAIIICWLPYMIHRVVLVAYRSKSHDVTLTNVLLCIGFLKSTLYPITYYYRNRKFRAACKHIFPPLEKLSVKFYTLKQRRVNPRSLYECSSADTRI